MEDLHQQDCTFGMAGAVSITSEMNTGHVFDSPVSGNITCNVVDTGRHASRTTTHSIRQDRVHLPAHLRFLAKHTVLSR